ncbi:MAG: PKD domain-containing protein [Deltaproteobacteria bacterium]|nr:PKD domain-containing protein [Deltaproteobacteria bacterium]
MKIETRVGLVILLLAAFVCLPAANALAQYQGIWKDGADPAKHNFYIQHYSTGSTLAVYTADAVRFYAFLSDLSDGQFQAVSMDVPDGSKTLSITFISHNHAVAAITNNISHTTTITDIEKKHPAVRTMHSGIWKDATSAFSLYVQDYAAGSSVVVYTFDGVTFQAFAGDLSMFLFSAANLADQSERLDLVFTGFDKGIVTVGPAAAPTYAPAANFTYDVVKAFSPGTLDVGFQFTPTTGAAPFEVAFVDISTIGFDSWSWDFGDGGASAEQNPKHTYSLPGEYEVTVTMSASGLSYACMASETVKVREMGWNPTIGGVVTLSPSGAPLAGVAITADNGGGSTVTDGSGEYSLTVPHGWSGLLTPSLVGYTFSPGSPSFSDVTTNRTLNFTASLQYVPVSGTVTDGETGLALQWVEVTLQGYGSTWTDARGAWSTQVPYGWAGAVSASLAAYIFLPAEIILDGVTSPATAVDFTGAPLQTSITLSGTVTARPEDGGRGIAGVTISYAGDSAGGSTTTDEGGAYTFTVPSGWSGYALAAKTGWTFQPPSIGYSNMTADSVKDYTGFADLVIAGNIVADQSLGGAYLAEVDVVFTSDEGPWSVETDGSGDYSSTVPYGWSGTVTPTLTGWSFDPGFRTFSGLTESVSDADFVGY